MKFKTFTAGLCLSAGLTAGAAYADCGSVSITEMDWASASVVTSVASFLMTQGYSCDVTVVPTTTVPAMTSVAETGQPDILTELWTSYTEVYEELVADGKLVELSKVLSDGGVEAWWIPQYLADAHPELTTLEGIKANPDLVGGLFHDCPSGWGCDITNNNNFKASGLAEAGVERFQHGSGETLATAIAAAYEAQEPWFGYYWAPTSVLGKYPMVQVEMPPYDEATHTCNGLEDCATPGLSAYPRSNVVTAVTTDFSEREPDVAQMLAKMSFTNAQMGEVLAWQETNNASNEEAAVYFLTNYKDTWAAWLNDDARARLSALLQ
ncbi:glycine/betaine ABC transporter substrate-binding protein [Roseobacter denitrificans]|uniref:Glycine betaine transporter, substrate-binding protein n=1 Tax=Roseobacter denitrificans (strain ATCC 33942 / OCh 114) TaxID=375451 RepID=Q164Z1_ROSDO|nr:glycine betaine ABC transporter substrate-binding protein [Roseobacter denitrificans]ABG32452.1 glycine betaine transporter, substrate-binding protein [Roseobacter denitrificans OCh 114]AVL51912.1 glycine/betaine ABC transporter substrate-binding protein [Roseobacter denitrificans]SFF81995.1 glycine betaine/proline transport system substrate-binding protein [Roseobacter denitrificans OCh 114]